MILVNSHCLPLIHLIILLADTIRNISTRFQVGFGTFVDKVTLPYISRVQITYEYDITGQMILMSYL